MKICQLAAVDFTIYHFLLPLMEDQRAAGHDVVAVSAASEYVDRIEERDFRLEIIDFDRSYNIINHIKAYKKLVPFFKREKFDMVHVHTPVAALIGRLAAARAGVPTIVYTAHGFYFHDRQSFLIRSAFIALEWIGGRFTDVLFTEAQEDADSGRRYNLCKGGLIKAIGNGVSTDRFNASKDNQKIRQSIRTELAAKDDDVVILMIGRFVAEKGYPELFKAMENVNAHLWVIGSRLESDHAVSIDDALDKIKSNPELSSRIKFLGYRGDVEDVMQAADIFTLPSHREGMPRSIIEAMMSGLPVVATDIRGSREEVIHQGTGFIVAVNAPDELADALNQLVQSKERRIAMGNAGKSRATDLYDEQKVINRQLETLCLTAGTTT